MQCPRCQRDNSPDAAFCDECGARLDIACPNCGELSLAGTKFCRKCGQGLARPVGTTLVSASRFGAPQIYTPKHIAEKILISKAALEGERKQLTVLFADMKGSMELLAERDPEDARKLLDPVLEHMMEAVHRYEGTVNQVMGDGIMALFGAPLAHEDHAVRACYAALRMQEAVNRYGDEIQRSYGLPIQIRTGLNSGEVVVRSIGNDLRMDYTAVGQTTHLAARMEQMAKPGSILMTANTFRLAQGYVQVKPLGKVSVKGLSDPVEGYELTGAVATRRRFEATAMRGLTRFVGRDVQLDQLNKALEQAGRSRGQVLAVVGDPGVGKSRLLFEFTRSARTHDWLILESGSVSFGKATTYLPVTDLLRSYFHIEARDNARKIREKVTGKLLTLHDALLPTVPACLALLDVDVDDPQWQALDPPHRRQRTLEALKRLLRRESQIQPLCVVIEDLQWIDSESQVVLDSLVESLPTARILLLVSYRPEYQHQWGRKSYYHLLQLDPLSTQGAEDVLDALLGSDRDLARLKRLLIERTEGNPFFLEECVQTLVETDALTGKRGAYRLARSVDTALVPTTVQAILTARIDRLPSVEKRLLQSAAVIGKDVPFPLLSAIAALPEEELRSAIARLQAGEFLYETSLFPDPEYTFKHSLTHEVAYSALLHEQRRGLHARIAKAIERLYPDRLAEHLERVAHHAFNGELWELAAQYCRQAGARTVVRSASRDAASYFEQALVAIGHLPETRQTLEQAIDVRLDLQGALVPLGQISRILHYLREAERLAQRLGDQRRLGRVAAYMSHCLWWMGEPSESVVSGQRALQIASELGDVTLEVLANVRLGQAYFALGEYQRSIDVCRRSVEILKEDLLREGFGLPALPSVVSRAFIGRSCTVLGDFSTARMMTADALRVAEDATHPYSVVLGHWAIGNVHVMQGDLANATVALERGLRLSEAGNFALMVAILFWDLGEAYTLSGRFLEGVNLLEQAVDRMLTIKWAPGLPWAMGALAQAYLAAGRMTDAHAAARRARHLCQTYAQRGSEVYVLRVLADLHAFQDPPEIEAGEAAYREALALGEELGMRPLVARCHLGLGQLSRHAERLQSAERHLEAAASMLRSMDMRLWLAEAESALKALHNGEHGGNPSGLFTHDG
jgi:class 3 adenylate cyclase/tetratricopeptide (TPR) repeat protein